MERGSHTLGHAGIEDQLRGQLAHGRYGRTINQAIARAQRPRGTDTDAAQAGAQFQYFGFECGTEWRDRAGIAGNTPPAATRGAEALKIPQYRAGRGRRSKGQPIQLRARGARIGNDPTLKIVSSVADSSSRRATVSEYA
jgi:hypothetical protein